MRPLRTWLGIGVALGVAACQPDTAPASPAHTNQEWSIKPVPAAPPTPVQDEPRDLSPDEFFAGMSQSVAVVRNPHASALGSAVEIRAGLFVTNCHVLENGIRYFIERDGKSYEMSLARSDTYHDICLLQGYAGKPHPVETRSVADVQVGERVYALGNPQGFELTLSEGLVSQLRRANANQKEPYIQTTAAISQGSSGGGLFDRKGRLIGISSFIWREGQNLNFAAPVDWALALAAGRSVGPARVEQEPVITAESLNAEAVALIKMGKASEAIPVLQQAAGLEPSNAEVGGNLGYAYLRTSQYDQARIALLATLEVAPTRAATWLNLGETYAALGDKESAVRSVVNGYKLSSRQQKVRDALASVASDGSASAAWAEVAAASLAEIESEPTMELR